MRKQEDALLTGGARISERIRYHLFQWWYGYSASTKDCLTLLRLGTNFECCTVSNSCSQMVYVKFIGWDDLVKWYLFQTI